MMILKSTFLQKGEKITFIVSSYILWFAINSLPYIYRDGLDWRIQRKNHRQHQQSLKRYQQITTIQYRSIEMEKEDLRIDKIDKKRSSLSLRINKGTSIISSLPLRGLSQKFQEKAREALKWQIEKIEGRFKFSRSDTKTSNYSNPIGKKNERHPRGHEKRRWRTITNQTITQRNESNGIKGNTNGSRHQYRTQ